MAHSSTLRRSRSGSTPPRTPDRGPPKRDEAAEQVQAVHGGEQVEEAVGRVARRDNSRRPSSCCQARSWPTRKASDGRAGRQQAESAPRAMSPRRGGAPAPTAARRSPATRTPVLSHSTVGIGSGRQSATLHAHEVGADEQREQRADDGEEHAEPDLRRRHAPRRRCRGTRRPRPASSQGFDISLWRDSHQAAMTPSPARKQDDDAHAGRFSSRPRRRRLVLRDEVLAAPGHAVVVGPAIDDRQLLAPVAVPRRRLRRLPFERRRAPRVAAGRACRGAGSRPG